jgi:hypothetical protein
MILGMSVGMFTLLHVIISLIGIASGAVVLFAMIGDRSSRGWTALFLATTALTSATGFLFHSASFGPPHVIGVISLVLLAVALLALYGQQLAGIWRPVYVVCAVTALYLNVFVGVVQAFQKIPALNALAPKGSEPPFLAVQLVVLIGFIVFGYLAVRRFHPARGALA